MKNKDDLFFCSTEKFTRFFIRKVPVLFFIFLLYSPAMVEAQNSTAENPLEKTATTYFDQGDFIDAYPLYSQLLSLYPRDPNYNYRFGACILYVNADKRKAVRYIQYGIKQSSVENLAYYYLGRAMHLNYEFDKAIRSYQKFEQIASSGELKKYPVKYLIEMCQNGKKLLASPQELDVLRKKELNFSDFFAAYNMHSNGGVLVSEPDEFKTNLDKKKKVANLMYLTPDKTEAFFSSYGNNESKGKDIYVIKRKYDGTWGAPENLGNVINTVYDEDYPIYDAPRHTLYFSSKGHNSMGGYDIFSSVYDDATQTWSTPENLDFPINTPDDDILFVPDTSGKTAFFASTRSCPQGKADVYKIALHLHPPESMVIAGTVYKAGGETPAFSIITVKDSTTHKVVAVDRTSAQNGNYSFNLPGGEKYIFTVEDSTHKGQTQAVVLAAEEARVAIEENIQFDSSGAIEIKNYPAETSIDSISQPALEYIRNQAQMNVNIDTNSIQSLLAQGSSLNSSGVSTEVTSSSSATNTTQIGSIVRSPTPPSTTSDSNLTGAATANSKTLSHDPHKAAQLKQDEEQLNDKAANATRYASDKMEQALQLQEQANQPQTTKGALGQNAEVNSDSAVALSHRSEMAAEKGMEAYRLAAEYKNKAAVKQSEINTIENTNSSIGSAINPAGNTSLNSRNRGSSNSEISTASIRPGDLIRQQAKQVKEDSSGLAHTNNDLEGEVAGLQQKSEEFVSQAGQTNDPQQKVALLQQADDLSKSKEEKQEEIKENTARLQQLHEEYTWLSSKAQTADSISFFSANKGNNTTNINPASQSALQQEIDAYTVTKDADSSSGSIFNNNRIAYHSPSNNSENQNSQATIANVSTVRTSNAVDTPSSNTNHSENIHVTEVSTRTTNHPYYKTSNDAFVDSIANTFPKTQTSPAFSPDSSQQGESSPVSIVQYTDTASVILYQKSKKYFSAAKLLTDTVQKIRSEARAEQDKNKSELLYNKADSIDALTFQLNLKGNEIMDEANVRQYSVNANTIKNITIQFSDTSANRAGKITIAHNMLRDADYSFRKSVSEGDSANNTTLPGGEADEHNYIQSAKKDLATAILKQQRAVYIYFQVDSIGVASADSSSHSGSNLRFNYSAFLKTQGRETAGTSNYPPKGLPVGQPQTDPVGAGTSRENIGVSAHSTANSPSPDSVDTQAANNTAISLTNYQPTSSDTVVILKKPHRSAYSVSHPIPIDAPFPGGLIFGVQVGAFRNSIPPSLFKGFEPIIGLKAPEGYVRYIAGTYRTVAPAKDAAGKIRNLGYPGAFVVAFYNGKRITIKEALARLGNSASSPVAVSDTPTNGASAGNNTIAEISANIIVPSKNELIDTKRKARKAIRDTMPPEANSMNNVKGLIYTVQVGSFSTHKGFSRLRKIKHLYSWTDGNGIIKYNSGTYGSLNDARTARDIIVANTTVKDAFVTVYYNGKRITTAEAKTLLGK